MSKVRQAGIPQMGKTLRRERLLSAMGAGDRQVIALVAPFGFGKTTLAADFVSQLDGDLVWTDLDGRAVECGDVLRQICGQLESASSLDAVQSCGIGRLVDELALHIECPTTLVLDDLAVTSQGETAGLSGLLRILRPVFNRIVLTTSEASAADLVALQEALVLDRQHLALTKSELTQVFELKGLDVTAYGDMDTLLKETAGNAGFAALLLESSGSASDFGTIGPYVSTQAMLEASLFSHESQEDVELLSYACMLGDCTFGELQLLGLKDARERLLAISRRIPLIRVARTATSPLGTVRVHQLVSQYVLYQMRSGRRPSPPLGPVLDLLVERDDWRRAADLVAILGSDEAIVALVERHGRRMIESEQWTNLLRLMSYTNPASVLESAIALLHWSQALHLKGDLDEALAKAAAAQSLATHAGDHLTSARASCERARMFIEQGRATDAIQDAEKCLRQFREKLPREQLAELLGEYAAALAVGGRVEEAVRALGDARLAAGGCDRSSAEVERMSIQLDAAWTGDWEAAVSRLSPLCDRQAGQGRVLSCLRGNLAVALAETGRSSRATSVLALALRPEYSRAEGAYGPAAALAAAGRGDYSGSIDILRDARRSAHSCGDVPSATITLLYQSVVERAAALQQESLVSAERASERLAFCDHFAMSGLAAVEVAASHASLGDYAASREWLDKADECCDVRNQYQLLAASAVAAVVARRCGCALASRLSAMREYISSGSASWRLAMYCRTFPDLLGILVSEVGIEALPGRMLDLLSVEGAQACLDACTHQLGDADRNRLSSRLLGECAGDEGQVEAPACVVGFFGGLAVDVDGRRVADRDWGKRKARQLFAMLVARRGHEIPRDQILEHLWPELDEERAKNNFYVAWSSMKAALASSGDPGPCRFAESKHGRCRARVSAVRSELDDFDEIACELKRAVERDECESVLQAAERLTLLYRGEFLPGDLYDDWFEQVRVDYRGQFECSMSLAAGYLLAKGECAAALTCTGRVLALDPLREDLYQVAMKAHLQLGQRNGAIEMFTRCKTHLGDELGLDPSDETLRLYQRMLELGD